ncbi:MAG: Fur family transcriptional regulator [Pseudomonadota bacterium]
MGKRGDALRAEVLEALKRATGPLSAYDILDALRATNPKIAPTTVYRTLSALSDMELIHRLESLNAYMLCQCQGHGQDAILSICDDCGSVEETVAPDVMRTMEKAIARSGFASTRHIVEVHGTCSDCAPAATTQ